nr:MAG TPA: hypothetical protein [Caudoviricetes sp.]
MLSTVSSASTSKATATSLIQKLPRIRSGSTSLMLSYQQLLKCHNT